jgi:eukaryotic-like serine/threonine-protein kinase
MKKAVRRQMTPKQWQEIKGILANALEWGPLERSAYLDKACPEPSLRRELESLIAAHDKGDNSFLEHPLLEGRALKNGTQLGPYKIIQLLGIGGMGEVYRARDIRLDREVALKVLPVGLLVNDAARHRFRKEARALAKLSHPHIAVIHDIGQQGGVDYLVMECVPGQSLAEILQTGPLAEKEIVSLGEQIAEALEEAHEHGIVHSDLKPANIIITPKAQVKVLDFGLARLLIPPELKGTEISTEGETFAGTLPYMAPEQISGSKIDNRTDLYAAGTVFYEMATGRRPFCEPQPSRLMHQILHESPVSPRELNPQISPALENIIQKCLKKEPENRFQSAHELGMDLRRLTAGTTPHTQAIVANKNWRTSAKLAAALICVMFVTLIVLRATKWNSRISKHVLPQIESLAVLPLANLSGDAAQDYFADGMTDELINRMATLPNVRVISRTSVMRYKDTNRPLREIGSDLKVDAIVEGSVLRSGNRVRITADLISTTTDEHLWEESYNRDVQDVLALQDAVADDIARQVRGQIASRRALSASRASRPIDPSVYESYLRGRYYWNRRTADDTLKALEYFRQTNDRDPQFAPGFAGTADCYLTLWLSLGAMSRETALPLARQAVTKALELDPTLADAHTTLGEINLAADWNWLGAESEFRRAIELNPGYATAHHWLGLYFGFLGRTREAEQELERARELDPLSAVIQLNLGWAHYVDGDLDYFINVCQSVLDKEPDFWDAHWDLGSAYVQKGKMADAISELKKASALSNNNAATISSLAYAEARNGRTAEARTMLRQLEKRAQTETVAPEDIGIVYVGLGDRVRALKWLQDAYKTRSKGLLLIKVDPWWRNGLGKDPEYQELLHKIGLVEG